jgi:hypothetical protein
MGLADQAHQLFQEQVQQWPLLRDGHRALATAQFREFRFDGFVIKLQFNPGRLTSSAAPVDEASIRARPCFLCRANRPQQQRELLVADDLVMLCNPFPIFPEHFTIPTLTHAPQRLLPRLDAMLDLAQRMSPLYTIFYNGPRCGASAPDHLHFQAGTRGFMPIDREYDSLPKRHLTDINGARIFAIERYLRPCIAIESGVASSMRAAVQRITDAWRRVAGDGHDEPMMNVLVTYDSGTGWRTIIFPRTKHRPSFYEMTGEARILLSPAAVDLGGVCITPVQRDFERLTRDQLEMILREVTLGPERFVELLDSVRVG